MKKIEELRQQLELVFARYMKLSDDEQHTAMDMTALMLRQMLREQSGRRQRLIELGADVKSGTDKRTHVEKTRSKLVRKTNASSPQAPIKPVQTTRRNELRRT
ncbi:hypothetical protein [Sedimentimonas flavescens]|uniref:hypothetical protein n=1 Tax=Sedimentimonas flavescens TaxID=2851012 RepID=UPI001C49D962|nr:hypothetical protein [Sedimentimonas flavescens]MBW0159703.1 hypothetical protein [Sedimentimonas flavescens]